MMRGAAVYVAAPLCNCRFMVGDRFPSPTFCCLLFPLGLLLRFPRGIFPLPVSIITVQSTPDTYGHDITANGLPPKKQQTILCYMVRPVIFYSPFTHPFAGELH